jgi:hypothetical protein
VPQHTAAGSHLNGGIGRQKNSIVGEITEREISPAARRRSFASNSLEGRLILPILSQLYSPNISKNRFYFD